MLQWLPTTGEFGLYGTFGDFDYHEKVATRLAGHFTHSTEDKQSQPGANGIENSQIRLTDGSVIFTPDLFAPGTTRREGDVPDGQRGRGRQIQGPLAGGRVLLALAEAISPGGTSSLADIDDHGYQVQASGMVIPKVLQAYVGGSPDPRRLRQQLGGPGGRELVHVGEEPRAPPQRGVAPPEQVPVGYTAVPTRWAATATSSTRTSS